VIQLSDFSKSYDDSVAVSNLSFTVSPGQVLGLVGRNGAGKTSTIKTIAGILSVSGGAVRVDGHSIEQNPIAAKQATAYVPDDPELFTDLTVLQHLQFAASVYGIKKPSDQITQLLSDFELEPKRHSRASDLSRGMRQKLAICSAWLQQPKALLLDEPMTGLDPYGIRMLKSSIASQAESGTAVIISSHLLAMVEDICSHILILDRGQAKFLGTIEELKVRFGGCGADSGLTCDETGIARTLEEIYFAAIDQPMPASHSPDLSKHASAVHMSPSSGN
jgi:ABC-2 type transport system ATP-binding protein